VPAMPQPEVYLGGAGEVFDADGAIVKPGTREFLEKFMEAFAAWIAANRRN